MSYLASGPHTGVRALLCFVGETCHQTVLTPPLPAMPAIVTSFAYPAVRLPPRDGGVVQSTDATGQGADKYRTGLVVGCAMFRE